MTLSRQQASWFSVGYAYSWLIHHIHINSECPSGDAPYWWIFAHETGVMTVRIPPINITSYPWIMHLTHAGGIQFLLLLPLLLIYLPTPLPNILLIDQTITLAGGLLCIAHRVTQHVSALSLPPSNGNFSSILDACPHLLFFVFEVYRRLNAR